MSLKTKNLPAHYAPVEGAGFEAIVSVFNNRDLGGDIVRKGAFLDSIAAWENSNNPMPVYWSHRLDDPRYCIGEVKEIAEIGPGDERMPDWASNYVKENGGLYVKAELDAEGIAAQVRHLLTKRRVTQFSYTYDIPTGGARPFEADGVASTELLKLALHEVGPTPLGMNPLTELLAAKSTEDPPDPPPDESVPAKRRHPSALSFLRRCDIELAGLSID